MWESPFIADRDMRPERTATLLVAAALVLASAVGAGLVAAEDFASATDGNIANGEELEAPEDNDDQVYQINYTFDLQNHQPGNEDGAVNHYAVGLTENGTLHRIKLVSDDFGFSNCEPDNSAAFGIDRDNDDPGTNTDKSLLTAFKSYNSTQNAIDIKFYKEDTLAGNPVQGEVKDQIVAAQNNCYDNPSEPGWYRINGTITGHVDSDDDATDTDYKIRDLSQWVYVCDCDSRAQAREELGPPPSEGGGDPGTATATATPGTTATATATPESDRNGASTPTATTTPTATATPESGGDAGSTTATATATATPTATGGGGGGSTATTTATPTGDGDGSGSSSTATPTATVGGSNGGDNLTPTAGSGPGFGVLAALLGGLLMTALTLRRRD
jgi:hypothetical protein